MAKEIFQTAVWNLPKLVSSPISRPYFNMASPRRPSGCGYPGLFTWPRILDTVLSMVSLALVAGLGWRYSVVLLITSSIALLVMSAFCWHKVGEKILQCNNSNNEKSTQHKALLDLAQELLHTLSSSLKSSSSLVPSAPPTFSFIIFEHNKIWMNDYDIAGWSDEINFKYCWHKCNKKMSNPLK